MVQRNSHQDLINRAYQKWRADWNSFVYDAMGARLDREQQAIIESIQHEKMVSVASGTSRGKDFVAACASLCFLFLTPKFRDGMLVENTKIAMTAPTERQVHNIMTPEVRRLYRKMTSKFPFLNIGRMVANDIRTDYEEWFLTGFKAGDDNTEAWSGFHAVNTMFVVTEASGLDEKVFNAIEGNLQGNSRLLMVFNPNILSGYAANSMKSSRFKKFRLDSLNAENVIKKQNLIPGQVDYEWVKDKVNTWCSIISEDDFDEGEGDFRFEGVTYRPNDLFRVKVRGMFPKVGEDALVPYEWVELANQQWLQLQAKGFKPRIQPKVGADVAGMGRDSSVLCPRYDNYISKFIIHQSGGKADHMHVAGMIRQLIMEEDSRAYIDTIGEGAGVYSRLQELGYSNAISCKFSESANGLADKTGQYQFENMRAYLYWKMREWLDPKNGYKPALPPDDELMEELTAVKWKFQSNGKVIMEPKEKIKEKLRRSPDKMDSLANTFYPYDFVASDDSKILRDFL